MPTALLLIALIVPLVGAYRSSVTPRGIVITHVSLFSFGAIFYWIIPIALGESRIFSSDSSLALWYAFFASHTSPATITSYLLIVTGFYLAFCAGSWCGRRLALPGVIVELFPFEPGFLVLGLPFAVAVVAAYAFALRHQFFAGYSGLWNGDAGPRGSFTAAAMLLLDVAFLHVVMRRPTRRRWWANIFVVSFALTSLLLLSLGGRLYVASAILMALVYRTQFVEKARTRTVILGGVLGVLGAGLTGIVRLGGALSITTLAANIASEPLFTSFSLIQFLSRQRFEWWNFPRFLLGDLINLVPTSLFPDKARYLLDPEAFGYVVFSPLGALNSFFSLTINFGVIGALIPLFALGLTLSLLQRQPAKLLRIVYSILTGWLAFTFFRDPFAVSVVKNMLEFGVLVPFGIVIGLHVLTVASSPMVDRNRLSLETR